MKPGNPSEGWWAVTGSNCGPPACKTDGRTYAIDSLSGSLWLRYVSSVYAEFIDHELKADPIPVDAEVVRLLARNPGCLDLYTWLTWRCHQAKGPERVPLFGFYGLANQLGVRRLLVNASLGLSRLTAKWKRLGIVHERIEPGEPQQNGRHERMHRTLKQETAKPPAFTPREQQDRFDEFRRCFNERRPHEALSFATPASVYVASARTLPLIVPEPVYGEQFLVRRIRNKGAPTIMHLRE